MKLGKECGFGGRLQPGQVLSCAFQRKGMCCVMVAGEPRLYCSKENSVENNAETIELSRTYGKLTGGIEPGTYYGFQATGQRGEAKIYCLDEYYREEECICIRQEGNGRLEDFWVDCHNKFMFFIYAGSIERFNLNGDYLGMFMKAPSDTRYLAMCTCLRKIYLAYEKGGCGYVAEYDYDGSYCEKISLGSGCQIKNMEADQLPNGAGIRIFVLKKGGIPVILNISSCVETVPECIQLEIIKGEGVGTISCNMEQSNACHCS